MDRESFGRHVKEALGSFYDSVRLQANPLADLLELPRAPTETAAQALRRTLREAIEALRPPEGIAFGRPEWLGYRLLWLRYVQSASRFDACDELGLSPASFYRRHQEAVEAVANILWERYQSQASPRDEPPSGPAAGSPCEQAKEQAVRLARQSQPQLVSLSELLESVRKTILPLADQEGVRLCIDASISPPVVYGDPATLRQVLLNLLTESIKLAARRSLHIVVTHKGDQTVWRLCGLEEVKVSQEDMQTLPAFAVSQGLLDVYGSHLVLERNDAGSTCLVFAMPTARPKSVLVVDDDADAISLYRRYLQVHGYLIRESRSGEEMQAELAQGKPDLILLDLLMPREDGWGILERLKTAPQTADIPVVVCSVLSDPGLALALGAAAVLQKPITEEMLLEALQVITAQEGSEGSAPRRSPTGTWRP